MALKDWKKVDNKKGSSDIYTWTVGNKNIVITEIQKEYDVGLISSNSYKFLKSFKTKSQALKFAKAYMRKH